MSSLIISGVDGEGWAVLYPGVWPDYESGNGLDDDCDGEVDEAVPTVDCGAGPGEPMPNCGTAGQAGTGICTSVGVVNWDGVLVVLLPGLEPQTEVPNGLDDNCDGAVDEGF